MIEVKTETTTIKVNNLLSKMSIEEKVGQMNLYNGFWETTGPIPKDDNSQLKLNHLKKGWVGAMLNVTGTDNVRAVQKIAVEKSRLGIPLIIGFDVIHSNKTLSPIPLGESASWDLKGIDLTKEITINTTLNKNDITKAVTIAKNSDVVVIVLGEQGFQSGEGRSRTKLDLPGLQQNLFRKSF